MALPEEAASMLEALRQRPSQPGQASFFYYDNQFAAPSVRLLPGEHFVHDQEVLLTTTLGSCVAACLYDKAVGLGGMNHFMLPEGEGVACGRFGVYAMELLVNELLKHGAMRQRLVAWIFGGGQVMRSLAGSSIGQQNVDFVREFLRQEGIPLQGSDVLGVHPRRVCMFARSGRVVCRRLPEAQASPFVRDEAAYRASIGARRGGDVELFR